MLGNLWPELTICAEAGDGFEALRAINKFSPEPVLMPPPRPKTRSRARRSDQRHRGVNAGFDGANAERVTLPRGLCQPRERVSDSD